MKDLFSKLNLSDETRTELGDDPTAEQIEQALAEHNQNLFKQHREALANDDEFVSKYRDKGYKIAQAKIIEDTQKALKDLGYDGPLVDDKGNKPPHVVIKEWYAALEDKIKTKGSGNEKLQSELQEMARKFKELNEAVEQGTLPQIAETRKELQAMKAEREREQANSWLSGFLKPSDNYILERPKVLKLVIDDMQASGYQIGKTDDGNFAILDSSGNRVMSEDKTKVLKPEEIVSRFENDYIARSNGEPDKKKVEVTTDTPTYQQTNVSARQRAAQEVLNRANQG